tara:strand:+ start:127 stop:429 length:303 start_codon:yes stop_codon:yes gene_type:complete
MIESRQSWTKVTKVITNHIREGYYELLDGLKITGDHPIELDAAQGWVKVEDLDVTKSYIDQPTPNVYIETESGDFTTFYKRTDNSDKLGSITVHAKYASM